MKTALLSAEGRWIDRAELKAVDAAGNDLPIVPLSFNGVSSGRKEPLKRDIRVSSDKEQLLAFFTAEIAAKIKKGWVEV